MEATIKNYLLLLLLLLFVTAGCKKLVQVDAPDSPVTAETVFANDSLAQQAVTGLYIKIMTNTKYLLNAGTTVFPGLSADELVRTTPLASEDQFYTVSLQNNNQLILNNTWKPAYNYIYQCNICINGLEKSTKVTALLKTRLTGEVKFVRALCYFYLVNFFGDVPLALSTNADVNAALARSPVNKVYDQIVNDLLSASELLTDENENTLPSKLAALALLARVYLYQQQWQKAGAASASVINSGKLALPTDLATVFKSSSKEIIFQWAPVLFGYNSIEGALFIPVSPTAAPGYIINAGLVNAFETNDSRKANWVGSATIGAQTYYYPYKYRVRTSAVATEYNVVLRLAEQYLIRAEASAKQDHIADAITDLNLIRARAGLPDLSTNSTLEECLAYIEQERRVELFAEWGHRWLDLKRTQRADAVLSSVKGSSWSVNDWLYPIPVSEIEMAPNLIQNPGYE